MDHSNKPAHISKRIKINSFMVVFKGNDTFDKHIPLNNNKIKKYECKHCTHGSKFMQNLRRHIKQVHKKIKDVKCNQCSYDCSTKGDINKYINHIRRKIKDYDGNQSSYA